MHPMVHLGDEAQVVARFSPFGDDVILMQDRCTVCTKCNLVLVRLETVLISVEDRCTVCAKRAIGSEIILYTPDGSPM